MKVDIISLSFTQRGRITNDENGPVADQFYEIWYHTNFVI